MISDNVNAKNTMSGIFIVNTAYLMKTDVDLAIINIYNHISTCNWRFIKAKLSKVKELKRSTRNASGKKS